MVCDTRLKPRQTISERAEEVRKSVQNLGRDLASGRIKVVVSRDGGVAFPGWADQDRDGVTDACAYRRIMSSGSPTEKLAIAKAEQTSGRSINKQAVAQGLHSHDGGKTWHRGH
jgi:hypothetical protein